MLFEQKEEWFDLQSVLFYCYMEEELKKCLKVCWSLAKWIHIKKAMSTIGAGSEPNNISDMLCPI